MSATQIVGEATHFGPKPGAPSPTIEEPQASDDAPVIGIDGDEEDTGRDMEELPF